MELLVKPEMLTSYIYIYLRLATLKQSLSICCTMFQHWIDAERFPVSHLFVNTLPASWQSVYTQMWHRKPLCIDSVLKHCATNRKRLFQRCQTLVHIYTTLAFLALLGAPYICMYVCMCMCVCVCIYIYIYIYIYIHEISSLRVNIPGNGNRRSRWPSGQRCRSVAARLLGWRARIPPGVCLLWTDRSLVQRSPTECVTLSVIRCNSDPLRIHWISRRVETKEARKKKKGKKEKERNGNRHTGGRCTSEYCHVRLLRFFLMLWY